MFIEMLVNVMIWIVGLIFFSLAAFIILMDIYNKLKIKFADIFGKVYEHSDDNVKKAYILKLEDLGELNYIKTNAKNQYAKQLASERLNYLKHVN